MKVYIIGNGATLGPLCRFTDYRHTMQEFDENFLDSKHVLKVYFKPSFGGVWGAWMTFKKA